MPIIPAWSYCIVAVIMGAGMVWYIINRLNQAEADRIEIQNLTEPTKWDLWNE